MDTEIKDPLAAAIEAIVDGTSDGGTTETATDKPRKRRRSRVLLGLIFMGAGVNHFLMPKAYERIVPPSMKGRAKDIVAVSGVAEFAGGLGVLLPWTRRPAGLGLVALLAAVFPANLYMAQTPEHFAKIPRWALYGRLPLQPLMMWWAWRATQRPS
jgi:uncharacterized membrane protein